MKNISYLIVSTCCMLMSCDMNVFFEDAMPPGVEEINSIPVEFTGEFMCLSDSSIIYSTSAYILQESYREFVTSIEHVQQTENCSIIDGGLYLPGYQECIPFEYISDDSISAVVYSVDSLFKFGPRQVAKYDDGHLFLNFQDKKGRWSTWVLTVQSGGEILLELIDVPNKTEKIEEITNNYVKQTNRKNNDQHILKPTRVEFDRILERGYLLECDLFIPISIENIFSSRYKTL